MAPIHLREESGELQSFGRHHEIIDEIRAAIFFYHCAIQRLRLSQAFEERRYRSSQNARDFIQLGGAHTIHASFVFLNLLERETERFGQPFLTEANRPAA
eukprot:gene13883-16133_t